MAPWSFTTFNTSESTSTRPPSKPVRTLRQIIIRQLRPGQKRRTRGQVPAGVLPHSGYVEATEAEHRWSIQNSDIRGDEVCQSFKRNQPRKSSPESSRSIL